MTAKLPPKWVPINLMQLNATQLRYVQSYADTYALQAVRDALERGIEDLRNLSVSGGTTQLRQAALDRLRALLKEYKSLLKEYK